MYGECTISLSRACQLHLGSWALLIKASVSYHVVQGEDVVELLHPERCAQTELGSKSVGVLQLPLLTA